MLVYGATTDSSHELVRRRREREKPFFCHVPGAIGPERNGRGKEGSKEGKS